MIRRLLPFVLAVSAAALALAVLWSLPARAADPSQRVVRLGFVGPNSPATDRALNAFWDRLHELGWNEGQNLVIEARWADGRFDRLPSLVADVVERKVDVLVTYSTPGATAAKNATHTIPIVVAVMGDPVGTGLVTSLARPGGNLTGLSLGWGGGIGGKFLELLQETVPHLTTVAVITNPENPVSRDMTAKLETLAPTRHLKLRIIEVRDTEAFDRGFQHARRRAQAVVLVPDATFLAHVKRITALASKYKLPAIYGLRDFTDVGGLMAYGPDRAVMFRRAADYVDKILKGAKPGDLPIEQPTKFELVVNLRTAKALSITFPELILIRADEVIR